MIGSSRPDRARHAWERWLPYWHLVFVASLAFATISGLLKGVLTGPTLAAALGIIAVMLLAYSAMFVRRHPWDARASGAVAYLLFIALLWAVLLRLAPDYLWLQPVMFSQAFFLLDIRRAAVLILVLVSVVLQFDVERAGIPLVERLPDLAGSLLTVAFFVLLAGWIGAIIEQSGERQELIDQLESTRRELAAQERQSGILEERVRVSRELHDTLAQDLVGIVTHLQAADGAPDEETARQHRGQAERMARAGLDETRRLVWSLRPVALDGRSLAETLERTLDRWRSMTGLHASLTVTGTARPLHPDVEIALLRSAQEGLANAARHGSPTTTSVTLSYLDDVVTLDVHDDGVGFDPGLQGRPGPGSRAGLGLGLVGMRERVERLGGTVAIESRPGDGTTVGVTLPSMADRA